MHTLIKTTDIILAHISANIQFAERPLLCNRKGDGLPSDVNFKNNSIMAKTANMDYLCVIREKNNKTYFETIDIPIEWNRENKGQPNPEVWHIR